MPDLFLATFGGFDLASEVHNAVVARVADHVMHRDGIADLKLGSALAFQSMLISIRCLPFCTVIWLGRAAGALAQNDSPRAAPFLRTQFV